jgi:hypothetical protein
MGEYQYLILMGSPYGIVHVLTEPSPGIGHALLSGVTKLASWRPWKTMWGRTNNDSLSAEQNVTERGTSSCNESIVEGGKAILTNNDTTVEGGKNLSTNNETIVEGGKTPSANETIVEGGKTPSADETIV